MEKLNSEQFRTNSQTIYPSRQVYKRGRRAMPLDLMRPGRKRKRVGRERIRKDRGGLQRSF